MAPEDGPPRAIELTSRRTTPVSAPRDGMRDREPGVPGETLKHDAVALRQLEQRHGKG